MGRRLAKLRTELDHRFAWSRLSAYVDDELPTAQSRRIEAHARVCPDCGSTLRELMALLPRLRALGARRPDESIALGVIARLRTEHDLPAGRRRSRRARRRGRVS